MEYDESVIVLNNKLEVGNLKFETSLASTPSEINNGMIKKILNDMKEMAKDFLKDEKIAEYLDVCKRKKVMTGVG